MSEIIQAKYGHFKRNPEGSKWEWTLHTLWDMRNKIPVRSFSGGTATVQVSDELLRAYGPDRASQIGYAEACKHGANKYYDGAYD